MDNEILIRLLWSAALLAGAGLLYAGYNWRLLRHAPARRPGLEYAEPDKAVLLYFTTPTCAPCKTIQRPAIEQLKAQLGDGLQVIEVDAAAHPEIADQWGVLSVPTTFVIDAQGRARHVNHGVTRTEKLRQQLQDL